MTLCSRCGRRPAEHRSSDDALAAVSPGDFAGVCADCLDALREDAPGACCACGHEPACGFASVTVGDETRWYCHEDDHSCYGPMPAPVGQRAVATRDVRLESRTWATDPWAAS